MAIVAHFRERIPRRRAAPVLINCGELVGLLTDIDPQALRMCLVGGIGSSRSFGCGLLEVSYSQGRSPVLSSMLVARRHANFWR